MWMAVPSNFRSLQALGRSSILIDHALRPYCASSDTESTAAVFEPSETNHAALRWESWIRSGVVSHPYWVCCAISYKEHMQPSIRTGIMPSGV